MYSVSFDSSEGTSWVSPWRRLPVLSAALALVVAAGFGVGGCGGDEAAPPAPVPLNAALSVGFTDLDPDAGQIEGAPTFTPASDESDVTEYRLYWGQDATTKLVGNDTVIDIVLAGAGTLFAAFPADTALPVGPPTCWCSPPTPTARWPPGSPSPSSISLRPLPT